jgi:hypothetical protein
MHGEVSGFTLTYQYFLRHWMTSPPLNEIFCSSSLVLNKAGVAGRILNIIGCSDMALCNARLLTPDESR